MNQREKMLAIVVGVLLVLVVGYIGYSSWASRYERLRTDTFALESKISDQETQIIKGDRAFQIIKDFRERSLPADAEVARSVYKAWLLELAEKEIELEDPIVTPGTLGRSGDSPYQRISLTVSGIGTLAQLTELMYAFYEADLTHQVRSLDIKPIEESRELELFIGVEAIVVDKTEVEKLAPGTSALAQERTLDSFLATILNRNLFGPANRPPKIDSIRTQRVYAGESLSLSLKADDPDDLDTVSFKLAEGHPEGASISGDRLSFRSKETGTYEMTVIATDDGLPPLSSQASFNVTVSDRPKEVVRPDPPAPKPKPYFEDAEFAFVTAILEVNGQRQLWLNVRTSGETLKLAEGDRFEVKRLKGVVSRIGEDVVDVTAAGESRRFELGENLAQGQRLPPDSDASGDGE